MRDGCVKILLAWRLVGAGRRLARILSLSHALAACAALGPPQAWFLRICVHNLSAWLGGRLPRGSTLPSVAGTRGREPPRRSLLCSGAEVEPEVSRPSSLARSEPGEGAQDHRRGEAVAQTRVCSGSLGKERLGSNNQTLRSRTPVSLMLSKRLLRRLPDQTLLH